ncbi:MAG: bifunctional proline dehydrogenase/L-glutamate gamma-semialdehyde dehydrogenase, partial [Deltaproteobacteria bacterium]|nr:bifunctional proline dehydrogenase/L-glutamate gamma-semialdehyde dehydrogenase [Deltaproteobacteria bacterium]
MAREESDEALETATHAKGIALWSRARGVEAGLFDRGAWEARLLDRIMAQPGLKTDLFRFLDVLPSLRSSDQVIRHVREYLLPHVEELPGPVAAALKLAGLGILPSLTARVVRGRVEGMGRRFIAGRGAADALPRLRELHRRGFDSTVALLGEVAVSDAEAEAYRVRYAELLRALVAGRRGWPAVSGAAHLSLKLSTLDSELEAADPEGAVARLLRRALPIFRLAREEGAFVHLDMEQWELRALTLDFFEALCLQPELRDWSDVGITLQAYLRSAEADLERLASLARTRGAPFTVRLVKGAYWDFEVARARQLGRDVPVFLDKGSTDANFERLTRLLLGSGGALTPALGSHNLRSLAHGLAAGERLGTPPEGWEVQMLYGMAEPERDAIRAEGRRVRIYAPVGELVPGMAYLVRRLLENTANTSFLRLTHREGTDPEALLAKPAPGRPSPRPSGGLFPNASLTDFTETAAREAFRKALAEVQASLPRRVPVVLARGTRAAGRALERPCPGDLSRIVSQVVVGTAADAEAAVCAAWAAWPEWRGRPVEARAELLERLAERLEADRRGLAALEAIEEAKPWRDADADVAEASDYCRFYARQAIVELGARKLASPAGEENWCWYEGRGPCLVIAPWNFPLAILTGMSTAALMAGNTVILKPAEQSSAVGYALYGHMREAGFPAEVIQFLPGVGEEVGPVLLGQPLLAQVAFTGSRKVGLALIEQASRTVPGQPQVRRIVCEMGGKNAIIVDDDADLDDAVPGVRASAFGYAGQKCSACSRVITVSTAHEPFVARLVEACRSLSPEPAERPGCRLPPVIDEEAYARLCEARREPGPGAAPLFLGELPPDLPSGYYVPPAVFEITDRNHRFAREELFGPVLSVLRAGSFEEALELA